MTQILFNNKKSWENATTKLNISFAEGKPSPSPPEKKPENPLFSNKYFQNQMKRQWKINKWKQTASAPSPGGREKKKGVRKTLYDVFYYKIKFFYFISFLFGFFRLHPAPSGPFGSLRLFPHAFLLAFLIMFALKKKKQTKFFHFTSFSFDFLRLFSDFFGPIRFPFVPLRFLSNAFLLAFFILRSWKKNKNKQVFFFRVKRKFIFLKKKRFDRHAGNSTKCWRKSQPFFLCTPLN